MSPLHGLSGEKTPAAVVPQWLSDDGVDRTMASRAFRIRVAAIAALLAGWQVGTGLGIIDPFYVSSPLEIGTAAASLLSDSEALRSLGQTARSVMFAFTIGTSFGIACGTILGLSQTLRKAYAAPLTTLLSVPKSIFLPLFILMFGIGPTASAAFGAFSAFFYVAVIMLGGVQMLELQHRRLATAYAAPRRLYFADIVVPVALPGVILALWHGLKRAFGGVMIAELFASRGGIGQLIRGYANSFQPDYVIAIVLLASTAAVLLGNVWTGLERRFSSWRTIGQARPIGELA